MVNSYATYDDVIDMLPGQIIIGSSPGQIASGLIVRTIEKQSGKIEHWNHDTPFAQTTYTDEYIPLVGIDKVALIGIPVISITSLEIESTAGVWDAATEGRNANTDDFFLEDSEAGIIQFHTSPSRGWMRSTYVAGYSETPYWLRELTAKMVARELFRLKVFDVECNDFLQYWRIEIDSYGKDIEKARKKIEKPRRIAIQFQARFARSDISDLEYLRVWNQ